MGTRLYVNSFIFVQWIMVPSLIHGVKDVRLNSVQAGGTEIGRDMRNQDHDRILCSQSYFDIAG